MVGAGAALEYASLRGTWDHSDLRVDGQARFVESMRALDEFPSDAARTIVVHVGHSTHLLSVGGVRMLTDPWFHDPAFGAMAHESGPACAPDALGPLDALLISHDHPDHFDPRALLAMDGEAVCLVPTAALAARVKACGFSDVHVLAPWETFTVRGARVTAVPALHDVVEIGFVVEGAGPSVHFAGDTALHPDLDAIGERFAPALSILPVDGTRIRGDGLHVMRPVDAVEAAAKLRSPMVMPSHAEAVFYDPLAKHVLTENIPGASRIFADLMADAAPATKVVVPPAGGLVEVQRTAT